MPRGLSSTVLPAGKVRRAASLALVALVGERSAVERTVVADARRRRWWGSYNAVRDSLPESQRMIFTEYRKHDEACLRAIAALCAAALDANPLFTVEMTADDFRLIHPFYKVNQ